MRIIANSLPKSGTHILVRLLDLLGFTENVNGLTDNLVRPTNFYERHFDNKKHTTSLVDGFKISLENPIKLVSKMQLDLFLGSIRNNTFTRGHLPYSRKLEEYLINNNFKILYIIRDPRDVLYSLYNYLLTFENCPLHEINSFNDRIFFLLQGFFYGDKRLRRPPFYAELMESSGWFRSEYTHGVRFEDIIGEKGGGDKVIQINTISSIVNYLQLEDVNIEEVSKKVFYNKSKTFHKGQIGQWRELMSPEIKVIFKEQFGEQLIKLNYEKDLDW